MKKIFFAIANIAAAVFMLQSCDSLDLAPIDYNGSGNYWKNESQVNNFVIGLHNDLRSSLSDQWSYNFMAYGEYRSAIIRKGSNIMNTSTNQSGLVNNQISEDNTGRSNWGGFYGNILQVNHLIQSVEEGCSFLSEDSRNYYLGIGYGLRAYYYFWLYRSYGGVPIETRVRVMDGEVSAESLYLERSTAEETLAQIKSDVNKSVELFEKTEKSVDDFHYWGKNASLMLKGEVYLWSAKVTTDDNDKSGVHKADVNDFTTAKEALTKITGHDLVPSFETLFTHAGKSRKENKETILALYYDKDEAVNTEFARAFLYHNNFNSVTVVDKDGNVLTDPLSLQGHGLMYNEYRQSFVESYDEKDTRRSATFCEYYRQSDHEFGCSMKKYVGQVSNGTHYFDADVILYRYADALLMLAEIENGLGNGPACADYITKIRERAYGANYSKAYEYTSGSKAENELAILRERDKEFVGEGKRWFDLLRLQDASGDPLVFSSSAAYKDADEAAVTPVLDKATESYKVLWPIERSLINNDPKLKQTVNYPTI